MSQRIDFSNRFVKHFRKAPLEIKEATRKRIEIFTIDRYSQVLNNHQLTGSFRGYRSINITGDWRAIYREYIDDKGKEVVVFESLGTHSRLYK